MKYILKIILLSVLMTIFFVWELLRCIWFFKTDDLKNLWHDYTEVVEYNYRRAFPRRSRKRAAAPKYFL